MCTVFSENVCEEQRTQVVDSCDAQEAYNTVQELSPAKLEKLAHCQSNKGHVLLIFLPSAVNFVKVSVARLETLTRLSE